MPRPVANPPNPWSTTHVEWLDEAPSASLEIFEEEARSILSENTSPDIPLRWSVNPYRGCLHACAYCYARPSHQYLDFGAGTDFDRKIVVKTNAADLLREAFMKPSWVGEVVTFSGNTDCYQALEANYRITRGCLEVCAEFRNPVALITKSTLIRRVAELLSTLAREAHAEVFVSTTFADDDIARKVEPYASSPTRRFETMAVLASKGIPVGVAIAPVIPGLNDSAIPEILRRAHEAGASRAFMQMLRLPREVLPVFDERMEREFPDRVGKIRSAIVQLRGGKMNESEFGERMRGKGPRWDAIQSLFEVHKRRLGYAETEHDTVARNTFRRPSRQGELFAR